MYCSVCGGSLSEGSRFCSGCGTALRDSAEEATLRLATDAVRPPSSGAKQHHGRFVPGTIVGDRYRIIALLGKGGMGEVYRADDLLLDQQIALKFLPKRVASDPERLARFIGEVRVARQIAHPNVCRVYDIGSVDGEHFLTMEYVRGEDLASLLHRIGRLAPDKATQIARQICAGLAAAHERGVLHRDLKPANIMLDERGAARITDFGLAGLIEDFKESTVAEGTPAYMAPEQLEGGEMSVRSDLYSLGLVLYELFTGRMMFQAASVPELLRMRQTTEVGEITLAPDIDPAVERVIRRCLSHDAQLRPPTALAVSAALPGGDPLAAALAAGETPSPELVAAAGERSGLPPRVALAVLVAGFVLLGILMVLKSRNDAVPPAMLVESPDALAVRARDLLIRFGYDAAPADRVYRFALNEPSDERHVPAHFWYRQSRAPIVPVDFFRHDTYANWPGTVKESSPALTAEGDVALRLDPAGHLLRLEAVPPHELSGAAGASPDWNELLRAAALDPRALKSETPRRNIVPADARAAWSWRDAATGATWRAEAAGDRGKIVYFEILPPESGKAPGNAGHGALAVVGFFLLLILVTIVLLARRNLRLGRGDRRGSTRLAFLVFVTVVLAFAFGADHVASISEVPLLLQGLSWASFIALALWGLYIAIEPIVRKRWPQVLISWTRLVSGEWRDPVVGRDVLVGSCLGIIIIGGHCAFPGGLGGLLSAYSGPLLGLANLCSIPPRAITDAMFPLLLLILFRVVLRKNVLAIVLFMGLFTMLQSKGSIAGAVGPSIEVTVTIILLFRFGLLALVSANVTRAVLEIFPIAYRLAHWQIGLAVMGLAVVAAALVYGFIVCLGGRPLFQNNFIEA